jgi:hypothetical protein
MLVSFSALNDNVIVYVEFRMMLVEVVVTYLTAYQYGNQATDVQHLRAIHLKCCRSKHMLICERQWMPLLRGSEQNWFNKSQNGARD